ncbi:MAG: hypothetical protein JRG77_00630 [Deltaproteobacteria bacterium]|nr:hypothetical protein [Deltaproteobacteria bacterium]
MVHGLGLHGPSRLSLTQSAAASGGKVRYRSAMASSAIYGHLTRKQT